MTRWLWLCLLACACDPGMSIRGSVHALPDHCQKGVEAYAKGRPLDNASIVVQCPGEDQPRLEATSNALGQFVSGRVGVMGMDCTVRVDAPGHTPSYYRVGEICAVFAPAFSGCMALTLHAELVERADPLTPLEL